MAAPLPWIAIKEQAPWRYFDYWRFAASKAPTEAVPSGTASNLAL
jgi:hypothetical protein